MNMTIDQPSRMATALLSALLTAALVLGIVSEHSFAAEGSDSDRGFANSPAVTLGLQKSGIDPSEIATYSQFAESLLADATARASAYGDGNVPAYAEYLIELRTHGCGDPLCFSLVFCWMFSPKPTYADVSGGSSECVSWALQQFPFGGDFSPSSSS